MVNLKTKVLFIHHGTGIGGASICLKELVLSLKNEVEPTILCIKDSSAVSFFKNNGIETIVLESFFYRKIYSFWPHIEGTTYNLTSITSFFRMFFSYIINVFFFSRNILKNYDFDILYLNSAFLTDWAIAGKSKGKKVIIHVREPLGKGFFGLRMSMFRKIMKNKADHIIAISHDNANRVNLLTKTTVIYDPMRKCELKETIETSDKYKYFLYLGGLQMIKGFYVLVSSLPYLNNNVRIFFAGNTDIYKYRTGIIGNIKKQIEKHWLHKLKKSDKIIEIGLIDNVYDYLDSSDFLLFPSVIPHFAGPVLEAYNVGKPVLVSDVKGMDEIVDEKTGFFFKKSNSKDLAKMINLTSNLPSEVLINLKKSCLAKYNSIYSDNKTVSSVINAVLK